MSEAPAPQRGLAVEEHAGRPCPYCRFSIKAGVDIVACGACGSVHHADCWDDNAGCSIVACAGGPSEGATTGVTAAIPTGATAAVPPPAPPPPPRGASVITASVPAVPGPPPPGAKRGGGGVLIAAILALAVAIGGVAVALVVTNRDEPYATASELSSDVDESSLEPSATPDDVETPEPTPELTVEPSVEPVETIEPERTSALPDQSRSQMRDDIQDMLRTWHYDIINGDSQAAWDMLTSRKQRQNTRKYGFDEWARGQATLAPYLDPSGLRVSIRDLDSRTGVAQVRVTGMSWSGPRCNEWSGITWVRYEDGMWRYDPGYSTTPQRERAWKHRVDELLGGTC